METETNNIIDSSTSISTSTSSSASASEHSGAGAPAPARSERAAQHSRTKPLLKEEPGRAFVESLSMLCRPWSPLRKREVERVVYSSYEEFPLSNGAVEGDIWKRLLQPDALLFVNFLDGALYYQDALQVLIEIKETKSDLRQDKKMFNYLGYSDYLYLAVVPELIGEAVKKVEDYSVIGVFDITTGRICKLASRQEIPEKRRLMNCHTILGYYKEAPERIDVHFPEASIGLSATAPSLCYMEDTEKNKNRICNVQCRKFRSELYEMLTTLALDGEDDDAIRLTAFNNAIEIDRMERGLVI